MNLPEVISNLIEAQDHFDSVAYANCFSETAVVFDEHKTHSGRSEIQHWIAKANEEYKTRVEPLEYNEMESILLAKISGTFEGSPIVLKYHFQMKDGHIQSLKITG